MRVGIHMPLKDGFAAQIERVSKCGAETIQLFSGNPRSWSSPNIYPEEIRHRVELMKEKNIYPLIFHTPYMVNLAAAKEDFYRKSVRLVKDSLHYASLYRAPYVVVHTGNHGGEGREKGLRKIIRAIEDELQPWPDSVMLLFENTAGGGSHLGAELAELGYLLRSLPGVPVGICFDTAHAWAAGYDLSDVSGVSRTLDELNREVGLPCVKVIHANDTCSERGSKHDRHQHIGQGRIGLKGLTALLAGDWINNIPVILETPEIGSDWDRRNIETLKQCLQYKNAKLGNIAL